MTARPDTPIVQASACVRRLRYAVRGRTILLLTAASWGQARCVRPVIRMTVRQVNASFLPRAPVAVHSTRQETPARLYTVMTARPDIPIIQASACVRKLRYAVKVHTTLLLTAASWGQMRCVRPVIRMTVEQVYVRSQQPAPLVALSILRGTNARLYTDIVAQLGMPITVH